jgi:16S rRNA (cytosine1402-N4)-methyltransferase
MTATAYHVPVMRAECLAFIKDTPPGAWVDGTLGGGGHTAAMLEAAAGTRTVLGLDQDPEALATASARFESDPHRSTLIIARGNFRDLRALVATHLGADTRVAAILLDLGVSSHQLDAATRGFGVRHLDAPLDMRMSDDPTLPTAREFIANATPDALAAALRDFGEIPSARTMATRLQDAAARGRLETAGDLVAVVDTMRAAFRRSLQQPAVLVAQALRIAVNDELGALDAALDAAPDLLVEGGRLVVMSYHSLEDRRVKTAFHRGEHGPDRPARLPPPSDWRPTWRALTHKAIMPSDAEIAANPRARSARLRVAARAALPPSLRAGGAR